MDCTYCEGKPELVTGKEIYPYIKGLHSKSFWKCPWCEAYVGCYPDSTIPLGSVADKELRRKRSETHRVFDAIWKDGDFTRSEAYIWLSGQLGIPRKECHIGMMDSFTCERVLVLCRTSSMS